jgi:hypothetical protein
MPLTEVWDDGGTLTRGRVRNLDQTNASSNCRIVEESLNSQCLINAVTGTDPLPQEELA